MRATSTGKWIREIDKGNLINGEYKAGVREKGEKILPVDLCKFPVGLFLCRCRWREFLVVVFITAIYFILFYFIFTVRMEHVLETAFRTPVRWEEQSQVQKSTHQYTPRLSGITGVVIPLGVIGWWAHKITHTHTHTNIYSLIS